MLYIVLSLIKKIEIWYLVTDQKCVSNLVYNDEYEHPPIYSTTKNRFTTPKK